MQRNWDTKPRGRLDAPLPGRRNLEFCAAAPTGSARPAAPALSLPSRGDQGAAPWLSLGSGVAPVACRPQTARRRAGSLQPMAIKSRYSTFGDFRTADYIKSYWLHVDVMLRDIFVRQRTERNRVISHQQPLPLEYCVLGGVGAVANTLRVGQEGEGFDRFIVEIAGYIDDEENHLTFDFRPSAKMVWNKTNDHSPRLDIYIPNNLSRRLIELYGTKRIDRVKLHTQIAVIAEQIGNLDGFPEGFPLLGDADHLYFRRAQCGLLSVITSLGKN
jgi:hypothetical protein